MLSEKSERMTDHLAYISDLVRVLDDLDALYARNENDSLEDLRQSMASIFALDPETPLQHIAIHALRCTNGVQAVLVGMRTTNYVRDVLHVTELEPAIYDRTHWLHAADELRRLSEEPS